MVFTVNQLQFEIFFFSRLFSAFCVILSEQRNSHWRNTMKRFISIFLVVLMLSAVLVGCDSGKNVSDNEDGIITDNSTSSNPSEMTRETTRETSAVTQNSSDMGGAAESGSSNAPRGLMTGERF